jgi:hypothetical protein
MIEPSGTKVLKGEGEDEDLWGSVESGWGAFSTTMELFVNVREAKSLI